MDKLIFILKESIGLKGYLEMFPDFAPWIEKTAQGDPCLIELSGKVLAYDKGRIIGSSSIEDARIFYESADYPVKWIKLSLKSGRIRVVESSTNWATSSGNGNITEISESSDEYQIDFLLSQGLSSLQV